MRCGQFGLQRDDPGGPLLVIAGACMYAPYGPFFAIVPEILPANVAGGAMALINSMGALGSFGASYLVGYLNSSTGSPGASYLLMSGALLLSVTSVVSKMLIPGAIMPIGVITALVGVPFFFSLIFTNRRRAW